ncbi:hypothetical protein BRC90_09020 [Halobacteriales archaeon QS_4_69_34]|nr:MAG: hypothetical protein BRC90_09020 [Halobacteriales archaeon QS_4_69_34]
MQAEHRLRGRRTRRRPRVGTGRRRGERRRVGRVAGPENNSYTVVRLDAANVRRLGITFPGSGAVWDHLLRAAPARHRTTSDVAVTNDGSANATGVAVEDALPTGWSTSPRTRRRAATTPKRASGASARSPRRERDSCSGASGPASILAPPRRPGLSVRPPH